MNFLMDYMRHHKRLFQYLILILIGIPFCMWTVPGKGKKTFKAPGKVGRQARVHDAADILGTVGSEPLLMSEFQQSLQQAMEQAGPQGKRPTLEELKANGTVDRILEQMENRAYLKLQEYARGFNVNDSLAIAQMKKLPQFQTEKGEFVPAAWNRWVEARQDTDWTVMYDSMKSDIDQDVYLAMVTAPANRVLDKEIEDELVANSTKLKVKLAPVDPPVDVTEEAIQAQYETNKESYREPVKRTAEYASVSLLPDVPEKALEAVKKAREGADFAALVVEYSEPKTNQGDLGWAAIREDEAGPRKILASLEVGAVSDPIMTSTGALIFKVEEERKNEQSGEREVKARQLHIAAKLSGEQRTERRAVVDRLLAKAKETSNLTAAAQEEKLEVLKTPAFTMKDPKIEGIPQADSFKFRKTLDGLPADTPYALVEGLENLYVAHVLSSEPGAIPALEAVHDRVKSDVTSALKEKDEYKEKVKSFCAKLAGEKGTLEEIALRYLDLGMTVKETEPFTQRDFAVLSKVQCYVPPTKIFESFKDKAPGDVAAPLNDYFGHAYVVQLVERIDPSEEDKAKWDEERKTLREQRTQMAQNLYLDDYIRDLRARLKESVKPGYDAEKLNQITGTPAQPEQPANETTPAPAAPQGDTGADSQQ